MKASVEKQLREAAARINFTDPSFSFKTLRATAERISELTEANVESSYGFLLRGAVNEFANEAYRDHETIYTNFVAMQESKRLTEVYGGLYRSSLPQQVDAGEEFQESNFKGFERELRNHKFGRVEKFERELFDDDMTGQVRRRASDMGEGYRTFEEIYVLNRLFGLARTDEGVDVPASTYNSGSPFTTTIGNRPTSYVRLSQTAVEAAHVAIRKITDPVGRKFVVVPKVLVTSPDDELEAIRILGSPNMANANTDASTEPHTAMRVNPLRGKYTPFSSPFVKQYAWGLGDPRKGMVFQRRDPIEITQENPSSGDSFKKEVYAFRIRSRWESDWIEPRFFYVGNDGSQS
jgi:hypothetical protein